jgi:hypothetical protein
MDKINQLSKTIEERTKRWMINYQVFRLAKVINAQTHPEAGIKPVVFFNASTRLIGISQNAAFAQLAAWALRMQKVPVIHFVCKAGMSRCVLGTDRTNFAKVPPCRGCIAQSRALYTAAFVLPFTYQKDEILSASLRSLTVNQLMNFENQAPGSGNNNGDNDGQQHLPLGQLVLPSMRWVLRRHHLLDDEATRQLFREYILSANQVANEFSALVDRVEPQAVVLFNGQFFPEATARWVATHRGIRTITHEVGLQPFSAFFTTGEATAYPLQVPEDFELSDNQNARLDAYLSQRFQGEFSMAGVRFWSQMQGLDANFIQKAAGYKQVVPVFTNVIFDTSQPHSNVIFPHMFAWLNQVLLLAQNHPETLFVLRAHPDEARPGKASQESVSQWVEQHQAASLPNLIFVDANASLSSYELIQRSKFVMVYNSTIGLEASIMGVPVLCAGKARYTQLPTVFFPSTAQEFNQEAENFLSTGSITIPAEFKRNARRFLYYQLYRSSLPFGDYLEPDGVWPGFVKLKKFNLSALSPKASPAIKTIEEGILEEGNFLLEADA